MKMLLNHPQHHHHLTFLNLIRFHDHQRFTFPATPHLSSSSTAGGRPSSCFPISCHQNPEPATSRSDEVLIRTHNAKSAAVVLRQLSSQQKTTSTSAPPEAEVLLSQENEEAPIAPEDKVKLLEMSLVTKRTPQFPGSIYIQSSSDKDVGSSLPPISTLIERRKGPIGVQETCASVDDGDELLLKALKIRRKVTVEIFKQAMRKGKFGITYYTNLIDQLSDYIDFVMIQAASMKQLPQFSSSSFNVRARTFIDDSGVVPLIRWLKHNSLSYPQIGKIICMSRGNLSSIRNMAEWLKSVHVKGRFIGVVFTRAGGNILDHNLEDLDEIVGYLERNGVRRDWIGYVLSRCPEILNFSMEELKSRAEFYINMGMDERDFGTMVFDCPKVLGYLSMEEMNQKVDFLKEFGLNNEEVGRLIAFKPQLMVCSIEQRWKPLVKYFYYLGISKDGMRRILTLKPMIFCVDLKSIIVPKVQFFRDIGVKEEAIGSMITKFPPLLTYSLDKKIRPVVIFLLTKAGVSQKDIGKVIALAPELLGCSIAKKLDHNLKYFLSLGISLDKLGEMIADFPMLLRYNVDVLRPKYRYLRRTMVRPLQDLIEFPRFFSYHLEERIVPRHRILVENRVNFKLRYMLSDSDEEFRQRVEAAVERRRRFESGLTRDDPSIILTAGSTRSTETELNTIDDDQNLQSFQRYLNMDEEEVKEMKKRITRFDLEGAYGLKIPRKFAEENLVKYLTNPEKEKLKTGNDIVFSNVILNNDKINRKVLKFRLKTGGYYLSFTELYGMGVGDKLRIKFNVRLGLLGLNVKCS